MDYSGKFKKLIKTFLRNESGYEDIFPASVAQFILESGRGSSKLAQRHNNFAGLKWRPEMQGVATKALVEAPSETAYFCSFSSIGKFVEGYWRFLDRSPYDGWEEHSDDPYSFIDFVAPIWATDPAYSEKLKDLLGEADSLISKYGPSQNGPGQDHESDTPCCDGMDDDEEEESAPGKPDVTWDPSPFNWSRGGTDIDTVVIHYTTSRSLSGTVDWFKNPNNTKKTAAHYVIGRSGKIVQMVKDRDACTHGNSQNRRSIGIEHSAAVGDKMTQKQERSSVALIQWLMAEYGISSARIIAHKCAPRATSCPGDLFQDYGATGSSDCPTTRDALQAWLQDKVL